MEEQRQQVEMNSGHFCQICKRAFASGRALGGHMRIHGTAASELHSRTSGHHKMCRLSESNTNNNTSGSCASMEESEEDFRGDKKGSSAYALRPNPKRSRRFADGEYSILLSKTTGFTLSKNSRVCEDCGKEFSSWKALLEHGRCHSDLMEETHHWEPVVDRNAKGKRSKRLRYVAEPQHQSRSNEQEPSRCNVEADTAYCLVMLSGGDARELQSATSPWTHRRIPITTEHESGLDRSRAKSTDCEADPSRDLRSDESMKTVYECKACKKKFGSFQALGGHRAGHSRKDEEDESVGLESRGHQNASGAEMNLLNDFSKPPIPRESSSNEEIDESQFSSKKKAAKVHECSICHRIFYSGQALGGHKRCHWLPAGTSDTTTTNSTISISTSKEQPPRGQLLDLNLPAPFDDDDGCTHVQH